MLISVVSQCIHLLADQKAWRKSSFGLDSPALFHKGETKQMVIHITINAMLCKNSTLTIIITLSMNEWIIYFAAQPLLKRSKVINNSLIQSQDISMEKVCLKNIFLRKKERKIPFSHFAKTIKIRSPHSQFTWLSHSLSKDSYDNSKSQWFAKDTFIKQVCLKNIFSRKGEILMRFTWQNDNKNIIDLFLRRNK